MRKGFVERHGRLTELDRSFDLKFWQDQPAPARFAAAWELVAHAYRVKGGDVRQLRLQRSGEAFQRQREGLTPAETESAETLIRQYERAMLARAQAAVLLRQRGYDISTLLNEPA